ncbi:unnamed protein product [Trichogramma brassicae]|uniref:PRANC domain-containing protein n=1 Tax=Trichogramma brassicae TaxID=86971 RepID=A0A6H5IUD9_9HYME|nr:unnamed protein product [Trichogramma brassicae]
MKSCTFILFFHKVSGYKYEPDVDKDGKPLLRLDTAVHCAARLNCSKDLIGKLFQIYNYGINFDYIDESGLSHFNVAYDDDDSVRRFFDWANKVNQVVQVNAQDKSGNSPLHWALDKKHVKIVEWLLKNSHADPNLANAAGLTPLQIICINQIYDDIYDDDFVELLFKISEERNQTVQVNIRFEFGNTLLHLAVCKGKLKMAGLLLRRGADPNLTNEKGLTPLHIISQEYDDDGKFLETFFAINDKVGRTVLVDIQNSKGDTALHLALTSDNKKAAELLLRRGANPNVANKEKSTPLHVVCQKEDDEEDLVKMLFELSHEKHHPLQVNTEKKLSFSPLMDALSNGYKKVAKLLLTRCDSLSVIDAEGSTPLHDICKYHFDDQDLLIWLFKIIIEQDRTIQIDTQDRCGDTLLHLAFDSRHENLAALLLRNGANPNIASASGKTPLHQICSRDYDDDVFDAAKMLFDISDEKQKTILVDAQDKQGWTPLHWAVAGMHARLIKLLLKRGASPNVTNKDGETPLHKICKFCGDELIEGKLKMCMDSFREVKQRVQADVPDKKGKTLLHKALDEGYKNLIEWLLRIGADPNCANKDGKTALHIIIDRHTGYLYDEKFVEEFFKIIDDEQLTVQIDVKDNSGRTPLQYAVANLLPKVIGVLLDRGANLSIFDFPTSSYFGQNQESNLQRMFNTLDVVKQLEKRGYELYRTDGMMIMKFLCGLRLFEQSVAGEKRWYDDEELLCKAKDIMIKPDLSLHDLVQLRPKEAAKLFKYKDYLNFVSSEKFRELPKRSKMDYTMYLCEITARRFFLRWALDPFMELIHYRLPILCCDMIMENLENKDLYYFCLAASIVTNKYTKITPISRRSPPPDEVFQRVIHYLGVPALAKYIAELEKEVTRAQAAYNQEREKRLHAQQSLAHTQRALQETLQQLNDLRGKKERERLARERARTAAEKIKERKLRRRFLKYFGTEEPTSTHTSSHSQIAVQCRQVTTPQRRQRRTRRRLQPVISNEKGTRCRVSSTARFRKSTNFERKLNSKMQTNNVNPESERNFNNDLSHSRSEEQFIEFVARSGYKDEPELDEDGKPQLRHTTAVHCAARNDEFEVLHNLFKIYHRFDVNYMDDEGLTHFHVACEYGYDEIVEKFLELGQDPNCLGGSVEPPLHRALKHKRKKVVESLLRTRLPIRTCPTGLERVLCS